MTALLSWVNWLDKAAAVITASSEVTSLPATRLAEPQIRRRWRTVPGITTPSLSVDFGASREIGVLALQQPDDAGGMDADDEARGWMASTDTVRHRLDLVTPGAGALLDTGAVAGGWQPYYGIHIARQASPITARYWRADLSAASLVGTPGYIDLGRAWAGPAWQPTRGNISYGWSRAWDDGSSITRNPRSGLETVGKGPRTRVLTFEFKVLTQADALRLEELQRIAGTSRQVLFAPFDDDRTQPLIGLLQQVPAIAQPNFAAFSAAFQIRQSL